MMTYHRSVIIFLRIIFCVLPSIALAAEKPTQTLDDYLPAGCYHSGDYLQQKIIPGLAQPLQTQGTFVYSCDHGLVWHTQHPIVETAIYKISGRHFLATDDNALNPMAGRVHQSLGTLLNHLIGGDAAYLQRHFQAAMEPGQLQLIPKNKRLKKFIQYILIEPKNDQVTIELHHAGDELTHITIVDRHVHEHLDQSLCEQLLPGKELACTTLLTE